MERDRGKEGQSRNRGKVLAEPVSQDGALRLLSHAGGNQLGSVSLLSTAEGASSEGDIYHLQNLFCHLNLKNYHQIIGIVHLFYHLVSLRP